MKQSLVFLHGGPGFTDYLEPYFQDFNRDFDCHFYDQLQGPKVSFEDLIQQLQGKVQPLSSPILVGHSWGAVLAVEFALRFPEQFKGIVTMCAALSSEQWLDYRKDLVRLNLVNATPDKIFLVPDDGEAGKIFLEQTWATFSEETFNSLSEAYIKNFDLIKRLNEIKKPFVNIYGELDLRTSPRLATALSAFNPMIVNHQIVGASHFPFLQKKHKAKILQILKKHFV